METTKLEETGKKMQKKGCGIAAASFAIISIIILISVLFSTCGGNSDNQIKKETDNNVLSDTTKNLPANNIGDKVLIGNIEYKVLGFLYTKTMDEKKTNGYFLVVKIGFTNKGNSKITVQNEYFSLIDEKGKSYDSDSELALSGDKMIYNMECNPEMKKAGLVIFEVPNKQNYQLALMSDSEGSEVDFVSLPLSKEKQMQ
ncbi:MAG: DUF4352 domain-containing protein [Bacteroidota bacterium]|nr:DUF4352 domain-containing protein [Bacteroidota bacterium]